MNYLWFLIPVALFFIFLIPTGIELLRRKDKGPRFIPDVTIYEEVDQVDSVRNFVGPYDLPIEKKGKDTDIPDGTELKGNLVVEGNLRVGKACRVHGTLKAYGRTEIGESCIIDGSVLSRGKIVVGAGCRIGFAIVSLQNIVLGDDVIADAVTTEKTVKLGNGVIIKKRISGTIIAPAKQKRSRAKRSSEEEKSSK